MQRYTPEYKRTKHEYDEQQEHLAKLEVQYEHIRRIREVVENIEDAFSFAVPHVKYWQETLDPQQSFQVRYENRVHYALLSPSSLSINYAFPNGSSGNFIAGGFGWTQLDFPEGTRLSSGDGSRHPVIVMVTNSVVPLPNLLTTNTQQIGGVVPQYGGTNGIAPQGVLETQAGLFNPVTGLTDQQTGNYDGLILLPFGTVTTNGGTAQLTNENARGLHLYVNPGTFGASATAITVSINAVDPISGNVFRILASASLVANTPVRLLVYPGCTPAANVTDSDTLPRTYTVTWNASNWGTGGSQLGLTAALEV